MLNVYRSVKRETLKLIETLLEKVDDQSHSTQFIPPTMDPVLGEYDRNLRDARESEVLFLFTTIINKFKVAMIDDVPRIFEAIFQCTLEVSLFRVILLYSGAEIEQYLLNTAKPSQP